MKISELKEYQKVNRPSRDELGNRIYEEIEFEKSYDPTEKNLNRRLFSKIIDVGFVIVIQVLLSKFGFLNTENFIFIFLIFIVLLVLTTSIMESMIGSSLGKLIFNLEVINDNCDHLTIQKSLFKNIYSFGIILILIFSQIVTEYEVFYSKWLKTKSIYVIRRSERNIIKQMMETQAMPNNV